MTSERFRFGEFEFDAASGELRRIERRAAAADPGAPAAAGDGEGDPPHRARTLAMQRLAPQPARVLALLASRRGALLPRDEIRRELWPDVQVDFDTSLHFCIHQIRTALGDSASEPRYVETLPRRGYRLLPEVHPVAASAAAPAAGRRRGRRPRRMLVTAMIVTGAVVLCAWLLLASGSADRPLRIAIMPFVPPGTAAGADGPTPVADRILEGLVTAAGPRARIVGPTTTGRYAATDGSLQRLAADYDLDYVVNGRFGADDRGPRVLAELIRVSDGAHVWVEAYRDLDDERRVAEEIVAAVAGRLELGD